MGYCERNNNNNINNNNNNSNTMLRGNHYFRVICDIFLLTPVILLLVTAASCNVDVTHTTGLAVGQKPIAALSGSRISAPSGNRISKSSPSIAQEVDGGHRRPKKKEMRYSSRFMLYAEETY